MKLDSAVFYTNNLDKAIKFYRDFLKLKVNYITPGRYAEFQFENGVNLGIKKAKEKREKSGSQTVFIVAENIEKQFEYFKNKDAVILKKLTEENWGLEFSILDPDGNKIEFLHRKK